MPKEPLTHNIAHLGFGALIGATGTGTGAVLGMWYGHATAGWVIGAIVGVAAAASVAYIKEHRIDKNFSKRDLIEWIVGGVLGIPLGLFVVLLVIINMLT